MCVCVIGKDGKVRKDSISILLKFYTMEIPTTPVLYSYPASVCASGV